MVENVRPKSSPLPVRAGGDARPPRRIVARPRSRSVALLTAAAVGAAGIAAGVAVPAEAAKVPAPPRLATAKFRVTVAATQTTSWRLRPGATSRDCSPQVTTTGSGREVVRLRSTRAATGRLSVVGRTAALTITGNAFGQPDATASTTRSASFVSRTVAGSCGDNPEQPVDRGGDDCGRKERTLSWNLTYERGRLGVASVDAVPAPLVPEDFATCSVFVAPGVEENAITGSTSALPVSDLIDRGQRKHVVLGKRTWRLRGGTTTGSTTVEWIATLTRVGR